MYTVLGLGMDGVDSPLVRLEAWVSYLKMKHTGTFFPGKFLSTGRDIFLFFSSLNHKIKVTLRP